VTRAYSDPTFSYTTAAYTLRHEPWETPTPVSDDVPLEIFSRGASAMQALVRYLVDERGLRFAHVARRLGRNPKSAWASYHQVGPQPAPRSEGLRVPIDVFASGGAPLEALVTHLRSKGMRNAEIARALGRSPKTTHTALRRAEART
jgi:hypothetical protein